MTNVFQRIDTVFVPTRNIQKSTEWYVQVLGGVPAWSGDHGEYQCIKFGDTSITLFLTSEQKYFEPRRSSFNFYVTDAEEAHRYLQGKGVEVEEVEEYGAKYFAFFDIDGNCLEVCEY